MSVLVFQTHLFALARLVLPLLEARCKSGLKEKMSPLLASRSIRLAFSLTPMNFLAGSQEGEMQ